MAGLCAKYNITFAVFGSLHEIFFDLNKKSQKMTGLLGKNMNRLVGPIEKRKCEIMQIYDLDKKYPNNSFEEGSLFYAFEKKIADFYYRTETYFYDKDTHLFEFSPPLTAQHFQVAQFLDSVQQSSTDLTLFFTQNIDFILQLIISFAIIYTILSIFIAIQFANSKRQKFFKRQTFKNITNNLIGFEFNLNLSSKIGLILLFYNIYLFLFFTFLINNLKTEQIVVDTDHIIDSKWKLLTTKKTICWFDGEIDYILASGSPKNTYLYKVFKSKQLRKPLRDEFGNLFKECKFSAKAFSITTINLLFSSKLSNYFILMNRTTGLIASALLSRMFEGFPLFIGEKSFYEMIYVSFIRKTLDKEKKEFLKKTVRLESEFGLYKNLVNNFDYDLLASIRNYTKIYTTIDQYVDEQVQTEAIKIEYLKPVFIGTFIWGLILLMLLYSNHMIYAIKKKLSKFFVQIKNADNL